MSCCSLLSAESDSVTDCVSVSSSRSSPALNRRKASLREKSMPNQKNQEKKKKSPVSSCILCSTVTWVCVTLFLRQSSGQTDQVEQYSSQKMTNTYQEIRDKSRLSKSLKISLYRFVSDLECNFFTSEINSIKVKLMNLEDTLTLA